MSAQIKDQLVAVTNDCRRLSCSLITLAEIALTNTQQAPQNVSQFVDDLLPPKKVAAMLSVSMSLLEKWRREGKGPAWIRLEGQKAVRYRRADVLKFINDRMIK